MMNGFQQVFLAGLATIAFSACASAQTVLDDSFPLTDLVTVEQMHRAVTQDFFAPRSAQYKGLTLQNADWNPVICGWVNAHNTAGGYTPFIPFSYLVKSESAYIGQGYQDSVQAGIVWPMLRMVGCPQRVFE